MTEQKASERTIVRTLLVEILLPAIAFSLGVGFATGRYLASLVTGLVMSCAIEAACLLDRAFLHPRLKNLSTDWLQLGLEMTFSLLEHFLGAVLGLLVCSRIFDFDVVLSTAWMVVGGMLIGFPIIHGTETALRFYRQLKEKERQEEQLRILATEAELTALKAQINPHFLFNTLNTVAQLIHTDSAKAEETVERLAEMFRYVLVGSERRWVPLEETLSFLDNYLAIEHARFGHRLRVTREIAPEVLDVLMPSLLLQPLVENAIRHGQGADGSTDLTIRIQRHGDEVVITIADQGLGMAAHRRTGKSHGRGLRNADERLRKTYGEEHGLHIAANEPRGTVVTVRIPSKKMMAKPTAWCGPSQLCEPLATYDPHTPLARDENANANANR